MLKGCGSRGKTTTTSPPTLNNLALLLQPSLDKPVQEAPPAASVPHPRALHLHHQPYLQEERKSRSDLIGCESTRLTHLTQEQPIFMVEPPSINTLFQVYLDSGICSRYLECCSTRARVQQVHTRQLNMQNK